MSLPWVRLSAAAAVLAPVLVPVLVPVLLPVLVPDHAGPLR
jgi:hypothetical protein